MKTVIKRVLGLSLLIGSLISCAAGVVAQEPSWIIKPTEEHKLLQKEVGTWDATMKVWPNEGSQPMEAKATETNELLPGGLWLLSRFESKSDWMTFTGIGTTGYDPVEKKYVGTWVDTMSPHQMLIKSEYDSETKTMTGKAEGIDALNKKPYQARLVSKFVDDDTRTFEMHMKGDDDTYWKTLEIHYKRRTK